MLSKGHAVAALASIYAELGYFDVRCWRTRGRTPASSTAIPGRSCRASRSRPVRWARGFGVAQGFAIAGRMSPRFDAYCVCGDGELQEGPIWEAVMFAGQKHLDNLCVMVDRNNGQLDMANRMVFPMPELEAVFASFNWEVASVDATQYDGIYAALERFRFGPRNGKPTAIICHGMKGHGALSDFLNKHKVTVPDRADRAGDGAAGGAARRPGRRVRRSSTTVSPACPTAARCRTTLVEPAARCTSTSTRPRRCAVAVPVIGPVVTIRVPPRDKRIQLRRRATAEARSTRSSTRPATSSRRR